MTAVKISRLLRKKFIYVCSKLLQRIYKNTLIKSPNEYRDSSYS